MSDRTKGVVALVALAFIFGVIGVFVRVLEPNFTILQQAYLRIGLGALMAALVFLPSIDYTKLFAIPRRDLVISVVRAVFFYSGLILFAYAVLSTNLGNVSLVSVFPLLPLLGYILLGQKVTWWQILYIVIGFVGVAMVATPDLNNIFNWSQGEVLAFISAILFDVSYILRNLQSEHLNNKESSVFILVLGAIFLFGVSFFMGEPLPAAGAFDAVAIWAIVISALMNVGIIFLVNYGFERVPAAIAGNILLLETVFAVLAGLVLYVEVPTTLELVGGVVIIFSVYQINRLG